MILVDDRTEEQKKTHNVIVLMTDRFMSGWGQAEGGPSYAGWACRDGEMAEMLSRVDARSDSMRVRVVGGDYRPPSGPGHCHIYVSDINRPEPYFAS